MLELLQVQQNHPLDSSIVIHTYPRHLRLAVRQVRFEIWKALALLMTVLQIEVTKLKTVSMISDSSMLARRLQ